MALVSNGHLPEHDAWNPKRERLRFLPLLEISWEEWSLAEYHLLADALRIIHSPVTPAAVRRELQQLLSELQQLLQSQPLGALRLAAKLVRTNSTLAATFGLEVLSWCSADLWLLSFPEREDLIVQVQKMSCEAFWKARASAVLRSLHEQDQIFRQRCHSASLAEPWMRRRPIVRPGSESSLVRPPHFTALPRQRVATRTDGFKERTFLPCEQPRRHPRCFDSPQVLNWKFELPHRFQR